LETFEKSKEKLFRWIEWSMCNHCYQNEICQGGS